MKLIVLLLMFTLAIHAQRFVSGNELEGRLFTPQNERVLRTPDCPDLSTRVKLRATIGPDGRVMSVKGAAQPSTHVGQDASKLRRLVQQAKRFVANWRYFPLLVGGKPVPVRTYVYVRCVPQ